MNLTGKHKFFKVYHANGHTFGMICPLRMSIDAAFKLCDTKFDGSILKVVPI